jgi:hypothetical protein
MKYLLLMGGTKADADWFAGWTPEQLQANAAYIAELTRELQEVGVLVANECLGLPDQARLVRAGSDGEPITDGVFPESKEFLAGYMIVDVESTEQAYRIAARISAAPGNKERGNEPIEVRQLLSSPPEEWQ